MKQEVNCSHCGAPVVAGDKFCGSCGKPVEQLPEAAPADGARAEGQEPVGSGSGSEPAPTVLEPSPGEPRQKPWRLRGIKGEFEGRMIELADEVLLGRDPSADLRLSSPRASRQHARIQRQAETYLLQDEGSSNGTWLNGERVRGRVELQPGDELRIAGSRWRIEAAIGSAAAGDRLRDEMPEQAGVESDGDLQPSTPAQRRWMFVAGCLLLALVTCACCVMSGVGQELLYELGI